MNSMREVKETRIYFKTFDHWWILPGWSKTRVPFIAIKYCGAKERKSERLIRFTTPQSAWLLETQIRVSRSTLPNLKFTVPLVNHVKILSLKQKINHSSSVSFASRLGFNCMISDHSSNKQPHVTCTSAGHVCDGP